MDFGKYVVPALLVAAASYFMGSISFSIIFTKLFSKADIRTMGSGNAGTTNVLRSVGKRAAICTFLCDFLKGIVSVLLGRLVFQMVGGVPPFGEISQYGALIAGAACVMGHIFPIYFKFKGGKGILTASAMILMLDWRQYIVVMGVFILILLFTRIVSLGSMLAAASFPIGNFFLTYFIDYPAGRYSLTYVFVTTALTAVLAGYLIYKHKANIQRLMQGAEKKITDKASK